MLNGTIGIIGGKTGPYNVAYYFNDYIDYTYSTLTPVHILDKVGYYQTYTNGLPTVTAEGFYSNFYFVGGQIDTQYTNLTTAVVSIDHPSNFYLYENGVAIPAPYHSFSVTLHDPLTVNYFYDVGPTISDNTLLYTNQRGLQLAPDSSGVDAFLAQVGSPDVPTNIVWSWIINNGSLSYILAGNAAWYYDYTDYSGLSSLRLYSTWEGANTGNVNNLRYRDYNEIEVAANLKGYHNVLGNQYLWYTDGLGYITEQYHHPYAWEYNSNAPQFWAQDDSPAIRGTTRIYEASNSWSFVTNTSGVLETGEYGGSDNEFAKTFIWRINEEGILLENINFPYLWAHKSSLWFGDSNYQTRAYTSGFGGDPTIGDTYTWNIGNETRSGIIITGYYLSIVSHNYVINWKNPGDQQYYKMYFNGNSGDKAYVSQYSTTEFSYFTSLQGVSDINNDGLLEQWSWDNVTHQVTWVVSDSLGPVYGYLNCIEANMFIAYMKYSELLQVGARLWTVPNTEIGTYNLPNGGLYDPTTPYDAVPYTLGMVFTEGSVQYPTDENGYIVDSYVCPPIS